MKKFKARQTYLLLIFILSVLLITGCGGGGNTGHWLPGNPDTTAPTVTHTINANGATNVPVNTKIVATFSEAMDPLTITATTFTFKQGATAVPGAVTYSGVSAVFTPVVNDRFNGATDDRRNEASKKGSKRDLGPPFDLGDFTSFLGSLFLGSWADCF